MINVYTNEYRQIISQIYTPKANPDLKEDIKWVDETKYIRKDKNGNTNKSK